VPNQLTNRHLALSGDLDGESLDALLVTHLPNITYLTGLRASAGMVLVARKELHLLIDSRYLSVASSLMGTDSAPAGLTIVPVDQSYDESVGNLIAEMGYSRIGVEAEWMSLRQWNWLERRFETAVQTFVPVEGIVEAGRVIKDEDEITCFRLAGRLIASAIDPIIELVQTGRKELDIAAGIDLILATKGFEDRAFSTIVASGPNSALPHAHPSDRLISDGDLVLLDFGGVYGGYCVDVSRTVCVGPVSEQSRRFYAAVLEAQARAIAEVAPGVVASKVDNAARSALEKQGFPEAFGHGTGHGLGLEIHEAPRVGRRGQPGCDVVLEAGMVFTVEPGLYVPGVGGVRIEDDVLVTKEGSEVLTRPAALATSPGNAAT
jgi:Xaa-Pro aminopeptidase